jgi:metal-responsive CopG/Arc/MetJ family transcriptional regulator
MSDLKHATYDVKDRKTVRLDASVYPADYELVEMIQTHLGCSRSEVIRSAIRIMATQLPLKFKA